MKTCRHVFLDMKTCKHDFRHVFLSSCQKSYPTNHVFLSSCQKSYPTNHDFLSSCQKSYPTNHVFMSSCQKPVFLSKTRKRRKRMRRSLGNVTSAFVFLFMLLSFVSLLMPQRPVCGTEWQCEAAAARGAGSYRSSAHTSGCCR